MTEPTSRGRQHETDPLRPPALPFLPRVTDDSLAGLKADAVGAFWQAINEAPANPGRPYLHTFTPSEPPRRRWWQFWRRNRGHWPTHTFTEGK